MLVFVSLVFYSFSCTNFTPLLINVNYTWAERAKTAGMPERFAMENLGHNSKAVHRAYAKRALVKIPSLEDYEKEAAAKVESTA